MRAEDLKVLLARAEAEAKARRDGEGGLEGARDTWRMLVRLIRHIWNTGEIPQGMLLTIVVLIPKGNPGEFWGIRLLEMV